MIYARPFVRAGFITISDTILRALFAFQDGVIDFAGFNEFNDERKESIIIRLVKRRGWALSKKVCVIVDRLHLRRFQYGCQDRDRPGFPFVSSHQRLME